MVNESRPWSDLHPDILGCVAARLSFADQIRSRSVCKNWSQVRGIKPNDRFPWIFAFDDRLLLSEDYSHLYYFLYDLSARRSYTVSIREHSTKLRFLGFDEARIKCIKSSWLLLNPNNPDGLFLFNAFTQEVVDVPQVPSESVHLVFTFRHAAKSGHFVVYAVKMSAGYGGKISIFEWENSGERGWERSDFAPECPGMGRIFMAECVGDDLYCLFGTGAVGVFNGDGKSWSAIVRASDEYVELFGLRERRNYPFLPQSHLIELRGELFVMNCSDNWRIGGGVLRLDRSGGAWVKVDRLRRCALFFSGLMNRSVVCRERLLAADSDPTRCYYCFDCVSGVASEEFGDDDRFGRRVDGDDLEEIKFPWRHGKLPFTNRYSDHWVEPPTL